MWGDLGYLICLTLVLMGCLKLLVLMRGVGLNFICKNNRKSNKIMHCVDFFWEVVLYRPITDRLKPLIYKMGWWNSNLAVFWFLRPALIWSVTTADSSLMNLPISFWPSFTWVNSVLSDDLFFCRELEIPNGNLTFLNSCKSFNFVPVNYRVLHIFL